MEHHSLLRNALRRMRLQLKKNVTDITNKIDLSVIQKILSLKINSINPS